MSSSIGQEARDTLRVQWRQVFPRLFVLMRDNEAKEQPRP
jgi:hypothetical protein